MSSIGRLLTPYTYVKWGALELSEWDYGDDMKRPVVFDVEFSLQQGDEKVNNASFSFDPSPVGFRAYTQCTNKDNIQKPITIRFGYENGSFLETVYYFQDVEFTTGSEQSIKVNLAGLHKAAMTSSWWTEYIGDGTKEFTLKELWDTVTSKIGYKMVWAEDAEKKMKDLPKITRASLVKETVGTWLINTAKKYGFYLEWPTGSEGDHKSIMVKIGAADSRANGTLKVKEKEKKEGQEKVGGQRVNERYAFILGPTLVGAVNRKTKPLQSSGKSNADTAHAIRRGGGQDTSVGQMYSGETRSGAQPGGVGLIPQYKLETDKDDPLDVLIAKARKSQRYVETKTETLKNSSSVAPPTKVEKETGKQSDKNPTGTAIPTDKSTENCIDPKTQKKFEGEKRKNCEKKIQDAKVKKDLGELSECSCEIFMVPYMVGIQPKDFIVFPSLNFKDPYIEDWEVSQVSYKQQGAAVVISLSGQRPKPGADPLIEEKDLKKLQEKVTSMKTLRDWERYYWNIK